MSIVKNFLGSKNEKIALEVEEKCLLLLEMLMSINTTNTRTQALQIAKDMQTKSVERQANPQIIEAYKLLVELLEFMSDIDYEELKKN